ncbi:molybdenum cofactor guanylyltransferase MobA, partial [Methylobacterium frigidaeris]
MSAPPTLGVILAGGLSRRMGGGDKPLLRLGDRTLLERVVERLAPQCSAGLILNANGDPARFRAFTGFVVPDSIPDAPGPLAGVLAALDFCAAHHPDVPYVASVAGDTPFLPHDLVARLHAARVRDGVEMAVAASGGQLHFVNG